MALMAMTGVKEVMNRYNYVSRMRFKVEFYVSPSLHIVRLNNQPNLGGKRCIKNCFP